MMLSGYGLLYDLIREDHEAGNMRVKGEFTYDYWTEVDVFILKALGVLDKNFKLPNVKVALDDCHKISEAVRRLSDAKFKWLEGPYALTLFKAKLARENVNGMA